MLKKLIETDQISIVNKINQIIDYINSHEYIKEQMSDNISIDIPKEINNIFLSSNDDNVDNEYDDLDALTKESDGEYKLMDAISLVSISEGIIIHKNNLTGEWELPYKTSDINGRLDCIEYLIKSSNWKEELKRWAICYKGELYDRGTSTS